MNVLKTTVSLPEMGLVAVTRALFGAGLALLLADRLDRDVRKGVGWTLVLVGGLTTIPLALEVFSGRVGRNVERAQGSQQTPSRYAPAK